MKKNKSLITLAFAGLTLITVSCGSSSDNKKSKPKPKPKTEEVAPVADSESPLNNNPINDNNFRPGTGNPSSGNTNDSKPNILPNGSGFGPLARSCVYFDGRPWYLCYKLADADSNGGKFGYINPIVGSGNNTALLYKKFKSLSDSQSRSCVWWYANTATKVNCGAYTD